MSINRQKFDVVVIGGGASGMMAAGRAAERGRRVVVLEKNAELGKKLSITGGGRCNILNAEPDTKKLLSHYKEAAKFLYSPFSQHSMSDSWKFFETKGLPLVVEARKRAFPKSMHAPDVTKLLRDYLIQHRVVIKVSSPVVEMEQEQGKIISVRTKQGDIYEADSFILATGGLSHQETGSTGDGMQWLQELGYSVHSPNPDIVPLRTIESWGHGLSGTSLSFMKITFGVDRERPVKGKSGRFSRTGKILFTHFGLSGPLILNAASEVKRLLADGPVLSYIDMYPDTEIGTMRNRVLDVFEKNKNKIVRTLVKQLAPEGMSSAVLAQLPAELIEAKAHAVTRPERNMIADIFKTLPITIVDTMGLDRAVVSDGGVDLSEVDTRTMRSRIHTNLYFVGDVLHISRPSGGYSLQLCWTTGWVAGSYA